MASVVDTAVSSGHDVRSQDSKPILQETPESSPGPAGKPLGSRVQQARSKYRHVAAYHNQIKPSCLSREAPVTPSFVGIRNLMVIVLGTVTTYLT